MENSIMDAIRALGDSMPGGFFVYHADGDEKLIYANDVMLDIFGCDTIDELKELTGYTFPGLVHPDDIDGVESSIIKQVTSHKKQLDYVEYRITRKDGEIRYVDDYGKRVSTEEYGDVYFVLIRDITEIHAVREENMRRAEVIEGLSAEYEAIYLLDLNTAQLRSYRSRSREWLEIIEWFYGDMPEIVDFYSVVPAYIDRMVAEDDRARLRSELSIDSIKSRLKREESYLISYKLISDIGGEREVEMSVARAGSSSQTRYAVLGFRESI